MPSHRRQRRQRALRRSGRIHGDGDAEDPFGDGAAQSVPEGDELGAMGRGGWGDYGLCDEV